MAKKLTGLAEELKQLIVRCEVIDDWQPLANEFARLMEARRVAHVKLAGHIEDVDSGRCTRHEQRRLRN